jgi:hypothetical protein
MRTALAAAVLVATLAACGSSSSTAGSGATTTSAPVVSSPPSSGSVGLSPAHPRQLVPTHNAVDPKPLPFDPTKAVATDDAVLVRFEAGVAPCFVLDHYTVNETPTVVTITLYGGSQQGQEGAVCAMIALAYEVRVPLAAPLGTRELRSGA